MRSASDMPAPRRSPTAYGRRRLRRPPAASTVDEALLPGLDASATNTREEPVTPPHERAATDEPSPTCKGGTVPAAPRLLLSVPEAARTLGIARSTLYLLLDRHELLSVSIGHRRLLPARAVENYVERLIQRAHAERARSCRQREGRATRARERGEPCGRGSG
jgi:excisionase family DNA binding protein